MHVQFGCGLCAPAQWRNFDVSPSLRLQRLPVVGRIAKRFGPPFPANVEVGDVVSGLPVPDGACDAVYCSHVLEHLSLLDLRTALAEIRRILKPGGIFRAVVPDLEYLARHYLESTSSTRAIEFMGTSRLGQLRRSRSLPAFVREWLGNSGHRWMWDYPGLADELAEAGFKNIRRATMGDLSDPRFQDVELKERWDNCLGVECIR